MIIEAMKQALEALDAGPNAYFLMNTGGIANKLRQAIAEAEKQEPFEYWNAVEGWVKLDEVREHFHSVSCGTIYKNEGEGRVPLYANPPPKREWVGLTDRDIEDLWGEDVSIMYSGHYDAIRAIEAKLKQKNGYTEEKNNG